MADPPVVEALEVAKTFGAGDFAVAALRGVSLEVRRGEFVAVMGSSGSGKSTLLHVVGGLTRADSGDVRVEGASFAASDDDALSLLRRRRLGFVFQSFNLLAALTAEENTALPLLLAGMSPKAARERAAAALDEVGLGRRRTHVPGELSGGEQQRVAVARALIIDPAVVLADEPTGNLDSRNATEVADLLERRARTRGAALLLVTHDRRLAARADRTIFLRDGRVARDEAEAFAEAPA